MRPGAQLALLVLGALVVLAGGASTRLFRIPLSAEFGLYDLLPWTYWLGMAILGCSVALAFLDRAYTRFLIAGMVFFAFLGTTPGLFESNPPVWDTYFHFGGAQAIGATGHLSRDLTVYSANWPGFFVFAFALSSSLGLPPIVFLAFYPALSASLTFLAAFVFLRSAFGRELAMPAAFLGSLANVWAQYHVSPQSLGLVLTLLVLATVWRKEIPVRVASATMFIGLVISHPTSTILLLGMFAVHALWGSVASFVRRAPRATAAEAAPLSPTPVVAFSTTWLAWLFFVAIGTATSASQTIIPRISTILSVPEQTANIANARLAGNLFTVAPLLRLGGLGLIALVGLLGLLRLLRDPRDRAQGQFFAAAALGLAFVAATDIFAFGGQLYDRSLMLLALFLPAIALAGLRGLRLRRRYRTVAIAVLLVGTFALASTAYYQEVFYSVTDEAIATSGFLEATGPQSFIFDGLYPTPVWIPAGLRASHITMTYALIYPKSPGLFSGGGDGYLVFDGTAEVWYLQWRGENIYRFYQAEATNHSLIYSNGYAEVYLVAPGG